MPGWVGSDRKSRLPDDWSAIRKRVRARAHYMCEARDVQPDGTVTSCPNPGRDVDHVVAGDDHSLSNLQLLCTWHHRRKSSSEGYHGRNGQGMRKVHEGRKRWVDEHPGVIK